MNARIAALALFAIMTLGLVQAEGQPPPPCPCPNGGTGGGGGTPQITLDSAAADGKAIKGKGTYKTGGLTFDQISLFAVIKTGGQVFEATIKTAPAGGNWPANGTLDDAVLYKGTYTVWAVLRLKDANNNFVFYGSGIREATTTQGDDPPAAADNYIFWDANKPSAAMGAISGTGTYKVPPNNGTTDNIGMTVVPSAGGQMIAAAAVKNPNVNPPTWSAAINNLTAGTEYNVFAIHTMTVNGTGFRFAAPVVAKTP